MKLHKFLKEETFLKYLDKKSIHFYQITPKQSNLLKKIRNFFLSFLFENHIQLPIFTKEGGVDKNVLLYDCFFSNVFLNLIVAKKETCWILLGMPQTHNEKVFAVKMKAERNVQNNTVHWHFIQTPIMNKDEVKINSR